MKSFTDLGLSFQLAEACEKQLGWYNPVKIQTQVIPLALQGKDDVIGLSPPRSGKTGAFVLHILQALLEAGGPNLNTFFACVLSPTTEPAFQIADYCKALGSQFGIKCAVLVGAKDMVQQSDEISQQPHIIVGTPGRLLNHLKNTQGFSLRKLKYLVIDEAHLLLNNHFERQLNEILEMIPSERRTFLFSETMTEKVNTIQSVCLRNPVKIDESSKYPNVDTLEHYLVPAEQKDYYLVHTLTKMDGRTSIVFTQACDLMLRLALILRNLGFKAIPINGLMCQAKKLEALNVFTSGECNILLCNEVASRGLDIPAVDMVINYDIPRDPKDYMDRMGWNARTGIAISFVNPSEVGRLEMIERHIGKKVPLYPADYQEVFLLNSRVSEAKRLADKEIKESGWKSGGYLGEEDVHKIQSVYSRNHVKIDVSSKYLDTLKQQRCSMPAEHKEIATENSENSADGDIVVIKTNDGVAHNVERVFVAQIQRKYGLAASGTEFELSNVGSEDLKTVIRLFKQLQSNKKIDVVEFPNEQLRELVLVVYQLGFCELQTSLCQVIADRLGNHNMDYMRTFFGFQKEECTEEGVS